MVFCRLDGARDAMIGFGQSPSLPYRHLDPLHIDEPDPLRSVCGDERVPFGLVGQVLLHQDVCRVRIIDGDCPTDHLCNDQSSSQHA